MNQIAGTSEDKPTVRSNYIVIYAFKHNNKETIPTLINHPARRAEEFYSIKYQQEEEFAQSEEEEEDRNRKVIYHSDLFSQWS